MKLEIFGLIIVTGMFACGFVMHDRDFEYSVIDWGSTVQIGHERDSNYGTQNELSRRRGPGNTGRDVDRRSGRE